jgi:hypothetical protein
LSTSRTHERSSGNIVASVKARTHTHRSLSLSVPCCGF